MMNRIYLSILAVFAASSLFGQGDSSTGYTSMMATVNGQIQLEDASANVAGIAVTIFDDTQKKPIGQAFTDEDGNFQVYVNRTPRFRVEAVGKTYFKSDTIFPKVLNDDYNIQLRMVKKPGYDFDVTIFDRSAAHLPVNTLRGCKVEIYNNTTKTQELTIPKLSRSIFGFSFAEGNHYTILVRKQGYLNRRIEAYVDVNGCILCIDGMGVSEPDVVPVMYNNNQTGTLLGNIDLDSIYVGRTFAIPNVYYDFDKWAIRPEAAKVLQDLSKLLKDNPSITVELGSHTDARGSGSYNMALSEKRAEAAVYYMVANEGIDPNKITFKGYGESHLSNACADGVVCDEMAHQQNRRTEIKILGIEEESPLWNYSLQEIIEDKDLYQRVIKLENEGQPVTGAFR